MQTNDVINIGFNCSNEYAYITGVAIASILKHANPEDQFNIVVIHKDIPEYKQEQIRSLATGKSAEIKFRTVDPDIFKDYQKLGHSGGYEFSNYRLKLASMCPDLDKILFLDSDILVTQSLAELWQTDIADYYMAAVVDASLEYMWQYTCKHADRFPGKEHIVNTGVMLCNLKKWREDNAEDKILEQYSWYIKHYSQWPDQQALNMAFKGHIYELPAKYNLMTLAYQHNLYSNKKAYEEYAHSPVIIHYAGVWERPWVTPGAYGCAQWWHVARQTPFYEALLTYACDYKGLYMLQDICHKLPYIVSKNKIRVLYHVLNVLYRILPIQIIKDQRDRYRHKRHILKTIMEDKHPCHVYHHYY